MDYDGGGGDTTIQHGYMIQLEERPHFPTSHSLTPPFLTYETSNNPPPSPGPSCVTLARSSFSLFLSALRLDLSASVSKSSSNPLAARLALRSAFSISLSVGEGVRRNRTLGISRGSSYNPGDLFRGYRLSAYTRGRPLVADRCIRERSRAHLLSTFFQDGEHIVPSYLWDIAGTRYLTQI